MNHIPRNPRDVSELLAKVSIPGGVVADIGCFGWRLAASCAAHHMQLAGFDRVQPPGMPHNAAFHRMTDSSLDCEKNTVQVCVASHVLEHVKDPVALMIEMVRITKPCGFVWVEAPSELSCLPPSSETPEDQSFQNFWDDPTHQRPYPPAALYRLALTCGVYPVALGRTTTGGIPCARMIAWKPNFSEDLGARYVSLLGVNPGVSNAWEATWPEYPVPKARSIQEFIC